MKGKTAKPMLVGKFFSVIRSEISVAMCFIVIEGEAIDLTDTFSNVCDRLRA